MRAPDGPELLRPDSRVIERPGWRQLVTPSANGYLNEVSLAQLAPEEAEHAIDEAIAVYRAHGLATKWHVGPTSSPPDLGARLARRGFESWGERAMGISTDALLDTPSDIEVLEVAERELDEYVDVSMRGWSMPEGERSADRAAHLRELEKRPQTAHFFMARASGEAVGTAGLFLREGYGYLVGGLVLEPARGRGVYRALVSARLAFLRSRGDGYAVTMARESTSAPRLERLGFETLFRSACYLLPHSTS